MIELAVLGLLKDQDLHGYELKKQLAQALGPLSTVSFGSLYPALGRLQAAGAVETVDDAPARPAIPMTGSLTGEAAAYRSRTSGGGARAARQSGERARATRGRKVYRITPKGERLFDEMLAAGAASADDDRAFNLRLAFCRHLPPEVRLGLFERRRAHLVERLARARSARGRAGRLDAYTRSLIEHGTETTERDISWLDSLIATEQRGLSKT